jgi:hypothetical protein
MPAPAAALAAPAEESRPASAPSWVSELSAPVPFAEWASGFPDLRSCWHACRDPERLLWLAARTCDSTERQKQVVLCVAELAAMAQGSVQETDPRVTRAIAMVQLWAGDGADALDLFDAEYGAVDAAWECGEAADRAARNARAWFLLTPRHRPGSSGMSAVFGAWQRWREKERGRWLALAAASAVNATTLPGDATVTATEWADCVSQAAAFALMAMSTRRPSDKRPSSWVRQRSLRLVRRRLDCPDQMPAPAERPRPALGDEGAGADPDETKQDGGTDERRDTHPDTSDGDGNRSTKSSGKAST